MNKATLIKTFFLIAGPVISFFAFLASVVWMCIEGLKHAITDEPFNWWSVVFAIFFLIAVIGLYALWYSFKIKHEKEIKEKEDVLTDRKFDDRYN